MARTVKEYLEVNEIGPSTGLRFTCNDYEYLKKHNLKIVVINKGWTNQNGKSREEDLSKFAILNRIIGLAKMCMDRGTTDKHVIDTINERILIPEKLTPLQWKTPQ